MDFCLFFDFESRFFLFSGFFRLTFEDGFLTFEDAFLDICGHFLDICGRVGALSPYGSKAQGTGNRYISNNRYISIVVSNFSNCLQKRKISKTTKIDKNVFL